MDSKTRHNQANAYLRRNHRVKLGKTGLGQLERGKTQSNSKAYENPVKLDAPASGSDTEAPTSEVAPPPPAAAAAAAAAAALFFLRRRTNLRRSFLAAAVEGAPTPCGDVPPPTPPTPLPPPPPAGVHASAHFTSCSSLSCVWPSSAPNCESKSARYYLKIN